MYIIEKEDDTFKALERLEKSGTKKLLVISQTTYSLEKFYIIKEIIENERAANLDNLLKEVALHINELKKHKVKLQEKDRNSTEKDHQTIIEKEKERIH